MEKSTPNRVIAVRANEARLDIRSINSNEQTTAELERAQELGFRLGLALVVSLMIFATWNDLVKLRIFG